MIEPDRRPTNSRPRLAIRAMPVGVLVGLFMMFVTVALAPLAGCDDQSASSGQSAAEPSEMRLITLAPALSQMIVDLGMGDRIVAVAQYDAAAPAGLPVVGHFTDVDMERILLLDPTHVLMIPGNAGPPRQLIAHSDAGRFKLTTFAYPQTFQDVADILSRDDPPAAPAHEVAPDLGQVLHCADRARELRRKMLADLDAIEQTTSKLQQPSVLMIIGWSPMVMASGPGTVHDQLLAIAGGINACGSTAMTAPTFDREALLDISPQVVLLFQPDGPPLADIDEDPRLVALRELPIPAVRDGRVHLMSDPLALLPSTSLPRVALEMAKAIHPELQQLELSQPSTAAEHQP